LEEGSVHRKVSTYTLQHNTEKRRYTSTPRAVFRHPIPVFERPENIRTLDHAVILTGTRQMI